MSETVKRYVTTCDCMSPAAWGDYVRHDDYAALEAELATVKKVAYGNMELLDENRNLQAELAKLRAGQDGWKLVPVEPTPEMVSAAEEAHMPFGDMDIALRMAILSAAPAKATDGLRIGAWRDALEKIAKYAPAVNCAARTEIERIGLIAVHALIAFSAPQFSQTPAHQEAINGAAAPAAPATVQGDGWIPVSQQLPKQNEKVLVTYTNRLGNCRRVIAELVAKHTVEDSDDCWGDGADYDEATDQYYCPAGWYECVENWDELAYLAIHEGEVTHWMPLPAAPAIAAARQEGGKV